MSVLHLNHTSLHRMKVHAMACYPHECCGFLVGKTERGERVICDILEMKNKEGDSPADRFGISADDYRDAEARVGREGAELMGVYHSHPDSAAKPSPTDLGQAFPGWSYIILSVDGDVAGDVRSWRLRDNRSAFDLEELHVADGEFVHQCAEVTR